MRYRIYYSYVFANLTISPNSRDDVESESGETRSNSVASRVRKLNNLKNRSPPTPRYVSSNSREVRHHSDNEAPMPRRLLLLSNQSPLARRLDLIGTK